MERLPHGSSDEAPDDVLLRFVEALPTTIRDIVLARCCLAFGRLQHPGEQDLLATFRAILTAPELEARAYTCAKMGAVVELALSVGPSDGRQAAERDRMRRPDMNLKSALALKHWYAATEEFQALRRDALGTEALRRLLIASAATLN